MLSKRERENRRRVISCGACVYRRIGDQIQLLLVQSHKSAPFWGFPKGHVEPDESMEDAARREVLEETGLRVDLIGDPLPPCRTKNKDEIKDVYIWLARQTCDMGDPTAQDPDQEIVQVAWHPIDDLPLVHRYQMPVLHRALRSLGCSDLDDK